MSNDNDIRHTRHDVFLMHLHLVSVTQYRGEGFTKVILDDLHGHFAIVCADFDAKPFELDREDDPVHLRVNCPQKAAVSSPANRLKGVSSRLLRMENTPSSAKSDGVMHSGGKLLREELRWHTCRDDLPVHRTTADATLKSRTMTVMPSELYIPALKTRLAEHLINLRKTYRSFRPHSRFG